MEQQVQEIGGMNREIKFRGWNGSMWENIVLSGTIWTADLSADNWFTGPVMQYTGFKDKNGEEIYDGDICNLVPYEDNRHSEHMIGIRQVVWENSHACFYFSEWVPLHWGGFESIEIIGNIYENPELLK